MSLISGSLSLANTLNSGITTKGGGIAMRLTSGLRSIIRGSILLVCGRG